MNDKKLITLGLSIGIIIMGAFFFSMLWIPTEEDNDMKLGQFNSVTGTNDDLEDLVRMRNIGHADSKLWWAEVQDAVNCKIYSAPSITGASTLEHTATVGPMFGNVDIADTICRTKGSNIIGAQGAIQETGGDIFIHLVGAHSDDDGSTWDDFDITTPANALVTAGSLRVARVMDIFFFSDGDIYALMSYSFTDNSINEGYILVLDIKAETVILDTSLGASYLGNYCYGGSVNSDDEYELLYYDGTNFQYRKFAQATDTWGSTIQQTGLSAPATFDANNQQYRKQGNTEIKMDRDHLETRFKGEDWRSYEDLVGSTTNGVIWAFDADGNLIMWGLIWKDSIYIVLLAGAIRKIQTTTADAYAGFSDGTTIWFANGTDTIYQLSAGDTKDGTQVVFNSASFLTNNYPGLPAGKLITPTGTVWNENDSVIVYTRGDVKRGIFDLIAPIYNPASGLYTIGLESPCKEDFHRLLTSAFDYRATATDSPDIIADFLATCECLGTGTVSVTPAVNRTPNFHGYKGGDMLGELDNIENYRYMINADCNLVWDNGETDSGINILFATDLVDKVDQVTLLGKPTSLEIIGGNVSGSRVTKTGYVTTDVEGKRWTMELPSLTDGDEIQVIADALVDDFNATIKRFTFHSSNKNLILNQQIDFSSNDPAFASAKVTVSGYKEFLVTYRTIPSVTTDVYPMNTRQATIQTVSSLVQQESQSSATFNAIGSANAQWFPCAFELENEVGKVQKSGSTQSNVDATDLNLGYVLTQPFQKGSLNLYVSGLRVNVYDADANNYVTRQIVQGYNGTGINSPLDDTDNYTSAQIIENLFTALNVGSYEKLAVQILLFCTNANQIDIAGVHLRCYYA